jgi:glycosyltransferase involved in cell wall biosynthesis
VARVARRIVHLSHGAGGGAGRAARRAHRAARAAGALSAFAFAEGTPADETELRLHATPAEDAAEAALAGALHAGLQWGVIPAARRGEACTLLSIAHPGLALERHGLIAAAEVLHLHWTSWLVPPATLRAWLGTGRAVVWTLHDLWPMTGGCHYPGACEQWRSACLACPQIADAWSIVPNAFAEKRAAWSAPGPVIVAPSAWMAGCAAKSAILGRCRIEAIPNAIETELFAPPPDRAALRAALGLGPADLLLVAGAHDNREARKGGALLAEALARLHADGSLAAALPRGARVVLAGFGRACLPAPEGIPTLAFGEVEDDTVLAGILGAADLAVIPSREDNYPNIALEALACGTPCLATPVGGLPELVREGTSGLVAAAAEAGAIAEALLRFARHHHGDAALRASAREQVEAENALPVIGARLAALYDTIAPAAAPRSDAASAARALRAFARAPVPAAARPDAAFLRFPLSHLLRREAGAAADAIAAAPPAPPAVLALHVRHAHHGAHSGPWQFLRHLPEGLRAEILATPLGTALAGDRAGAYRGWSRLLGAPQFGEQANAWLAEAEALIACAAAPPAILHAIDGEFALPLLARIPAAHLGAGQRPRLVATFHQPPALLGGMLDHAALARLDAVIVLCEAQRAALSRRVHPARLHLIPHGVDTRFFTPGPRAPGPGFRLLCVGHWLRDHATAFVALALLREAGLAASLRLVTPHPPASLPEGVSVATGLEDAALREAYRDADALLLPLTDATANNAILEAMACGRPVVATDIGGVAEATQGAARLVPPGDARALAGAVLALAADPAAAAALGRAARARAEALDWRAVAEAHAALYRALIEGAA